MFYGASRTHCRAWISLSNRCPWTRIHEDPAATRDATPCSNPRHLPLDHLVGETGVRDGPQRGVSRDASPFVPSTLATRKTVFSNREMSNDERDLRSSQGALKKMRSSGRPTIDIGLSINFPLRACPHHRNSPPDAPRQGVAMRACAIMTTASLELKYQLFRCYCSMFLFCSP